MLVGAASGMQVMTSTGDQTTLGQGGSLSGSQYDAVTLQYAGNGNFMVVDYTSNSGRFR